MGAKEIKILILLNLGACIWADNKVQQYCTDLTPQNDMEMDDVSFKRLRGLSYWKCVG